VRWEGFSSSDDTWHSSKELREQGYGNLIDKFEQERQEKIPGSPIILDSDDDSSPIQINEITISKSTSNKPSQRQESNFKSNNSKQNTTTNNSDSDEGYIEQILTHRTNKMGVVEYFPKFRGHAHSSEDCDWYKESEIRESGYGYLLDAYIKEKKPQQKSPQTIQEPRRQRPKKEEAEYISTIEQLGKREVQKVTGAKKNKSNAVFYYLQFMDGKRAYVSSDVMTAKWPKKTIQFLEAHLRFAHK